MTTDPAKKPNVIFILGDDWGWGDLRCFGHQGVRTPNLDRLAREGARFTQFYVAASVCSPSRAAFMTGVSPGRLGFHHICGGREDNAQRGVPDFLDTGLPTVSRLLQEGGYETAHFGKWHLGSVKGAPDLGQYGFDAHRSINSAGPDLREGFYARSADNDSEYAQPELDIEFRPHSSRVIVDHAIDFLKQTRSPFFLQVWLLDPHATLNPTEEQMKEYRKLSPHGVGYPGANTIYYSVLTEADRQVGRLLDALDELGLSDNTIIVFTGDNGPEDLYVPNASHSAAGSAGPFRGRKRSLYEGGIRMPLIVRWPGRVPAGYIDRESVLSGVDLLPTLCALAGIEAPQTDGEVVVDALLGEPSLTRNPLFWEYRFANGSHPIHCSPMLAARAGRWKLLLNPDGSRVELYDIPNDPMELSNLAAFNPDVVAEMSDAALAFAASLPSGPQSPTAGSNAYVWPGDELDAEPAGWVSGW